MELLDGPIRASEWGSTTAIPELLGRPVSGEPVAELWLGAHPSDPALVGAGGARLDELIRADPAAMLGTETASRFGGLPFLLKVLAAAAPLSLQAHPSSEAAVAGFERENAAGIPLDAPHRSYRDRSHKPELICALTEFRALCGFRSPAASAELLDQLSVPELGPVRTALDEDGGLRRAIEWLLTLGPEEAARVSGAVVEACRTGTNGSHEAERAVVVALGARYPADAGVVTALLMNLVTLQPDDALFLGAGNLHCYLGGVAVEVLANSDNVLRGGLTAKHVDVPALLEVVDTTPIAPRVQHPEVVDGVAVYDCPVPDFSLVRIELNGHARLEPGPAIVLCTEGRAVAGPTVLERGTAAWVSAADAPVEMEGTATLFRAGVGTYT